MAGREVRKMLVKHFSELTKSEKVKHPESVKTSFKSFLAKSPLTEKEAKALLAAFKAVRLKK